MSRALLHLAILLIALFNTQTFSTWAYVLPTSSVCIAAAIRNKSSNFDFLDMFWLMFQMSFVAAPVVSLMEPERSILFNQGVLVPYRGGTSTILYRQDQVLLLYFMVFVVAVINAIFLPKTYRAKKQKNIVFQPSLIVCLTLLLIAFIINVGAQGGLGNVLAPRYLKADNAVGIFGIFFSSFTLAMAYITVLSGKYYPPTARYLSGALVLIVLLVLYNPFNASRFRLIQAYLPILFMFLPSLSKFNYMALTISFGAIVVMPILSVTTRYGLNADLSNLELSTSGFLGFLDQHKNLIHLIDMCQHNGFLLGESTLSVLLFFVPRALWPAKPEVVALYVGNDLYGNGFVGTANLSGPIISDFYLDFGLLGVIIGSVLTALLVRKLLSYSYSVNGTPILSYIFLAALPILFRGSVGAVVGDVLFTTAFFISIIFVTQRIRFLRV